MFGSSFCKNLCVFIFSFRESSNPPTGCSICDDRTEVVGLHQSADLKVLVRSSRPHPTSPTSFRQAHTDSNAACRSSPAGSKSCSVFRRPEPSAADAPPSTAQWTPGKPCTAEVMAIGAVSSRTVSLKRTPGAAVASRPPDAGDQAERRLRPV